MSFDAVVGVLATLVLVATIVERMLAFVFEHDWFVRLTTRLDAANTRVSKWPGLKGVLALAASLGISFGYDFDIFKVLFPENSNEVTGKLITGFVIAGGSAGALAIFQSYLGIGKDSRDAIIKARKAEAVSAKEVAELATAEARAKRDKAEAEKREAELRENAAKGGTTAIPPAA